MNTTTEQPQITREEVIARFKADIEVQSLQTELVELRARAVLAQLNEVKIMMAYQELTQPSKVQPTTEELEDMKLEAMANESASIASSTDSTII